MTSAKKLLLNDGIRIMCGVLFVLVTAGIAYGQEQYDPDSGSAAYTADINELNPNLTDGDVSGSATFIVAGNQLYVTIVVKGVAPSMMHLQHIHGFKASMKESSCPAQSADTNGDGIIDLIETHPSSGVTLIPFNAAPAKLKVLSSSYPVANNNGLLTYRIKIPLKSLKSAIQDKYGIDKLALANRVIYIHGVPKSTALPGSVQSLPGVPARVTVPIACGEIKSL